jgi:hypothetical protein
VNSKNNGRNLQRHSRTSHEFQLKALTAPLSKRNIDGFSIRAFQPDGSNDRQCQEAPAYSGTVASPWEHTTARSPLDIGSSRGLDHAAQGDAAIKDHWLPPKRRRLVESVSSDAISPGSPVGEYSSPSSTRCNRVTRLPGAAEHRRTSGEVSQTSTGRSYGYAEPTSDADHCAVAEENLSPHVSDEYSLQPFESVQESCLLRYFIEELSHWVGQMND